MLPTKTVLDDMTPEMRRLFMHIAWEAARHNVEMVDGQTGFDDDDRGAVRALVEVLVTMASGKVGKDAMHEAIDVLTRAYLKFGEHITCNPRAEVS